MPKLVVVRHGQSTWNKENRFTGWTDVDLSMQGIEEAKRAGKALKEHGYTFDIAYTSVLKRAIRTLRIVLDELDLMWIPVHASWRLNERHYGALQGLDKAETAQKFGDEQVLIWRRSYDIRPPLLDKSDERYPGKEPQYAEIEREILPAGECLKDTVARFLPYWKDTIVPELMSGKKVIISAHGNSLRALTKYLEGISDDGILALNIPTGIPLVYELEDDLTLIRKYYLGDPEQVEKATQSVANQGKARH